jgi:ubiquinone/menaquinone biosynthesis C-methylase UbiE
MERAEYERIAHAEADHWWYQSTRRIARTMLQPWLRTGIRSLDAGCGPGGNGAWLAEFGPVVGVDYSYDALQFVQSSHSATIPIHASVTDLPLASASIDVCLAATVLYTVEHDQRAVRELGRVLRTGGAALLIEPAFQALRRAHDEVVHGRRRYRTRDLAAMLDASGLHVVRSTYAKSFLAPPAFVLGAIERMRRSGAAKSDLESHGVDSLIDPAFRRLATVEDRWIARRAMPFGTSAIVLATKR